MFVPDSDKALLCSEICLNEKLSGGTYIYVNIQFRITFIRFCYLNDSTGFFKTCSFPSLIVSPKPNL